MTCNKLDRNVPDYVEISGSVNEYGILKYSYYSIGVTCCHRENHWIKTDGVTVVYNPKYGSLVVSLSDLISKEK